MFVIPAPLRLDLGAGKPPIILISDSSDLTSGAEYVPDGILQTRLYS